MKAALKQYIKQALTSLMIEVADAAIQVTESKDKRHGHYTTNIALMLAKLRQIQPMDLAEQLVGAMKDRTDIAAISIAKPGFINITLTTQALERVVQTVLTEAEQYGRVAFNGQTSLVEYVSANPTGPLHVGHGRSAVFGSVLVNVLRACGYQVVGEYYVNDAGRQMDILTVSVWLRYLQQHHRDVPFPAHGYQGDYIRAAAKQLPAQRYERILAPLLAELPTDGPESLEKERYLDAFIKGMYEILGSDVHTLRQTILRYMLADIQTDLIRLGVEQQWYFEQSLIDKKMVTLVIERLDASGYLYQKDEAIWFGSSQFGDTKDRVLIRSNGQYTYFAVDLAYHYDKLHRGFDRIIDVFGADHHGYVPRIRAGLQALGYGDAVFQICLLQFVTLQQKGQAQQMSTRQGSFVTLRELCDDIGEDAVRYFYLMRKGDQHIEFDVDLAKQHSQANPVYYLQYAHARICSVFKQLKQKRWAWDRHASGQYSAYLTSDYEHVLLFDLIRYPDVVASAGLHLEPHQLITYLQSLAHHFHTYYNAEMILVEQPELRNARLDLIAAVQQVLYNALTLIGIKAPESM